MLREYKTHFLQSEKGLVVKWSSQLEVLSHEAVGCFFTHCGWNSTIEAVSLGMPPRTDQTTNAKLVKDLWEMGVRVKVDEKGIVGREEVEFRIREVMEGERAKEMKKNDQKRREVAIQATSKGGSSDKNIDEFISKIKG